MDDYLFLIIAIVLSVFAAINQSKKKKNDENIFVDKTKRSRNFFIDQLLGEDFPEKPEEEIKSPVRVKPVVLQKKPTVNTIPVSQSGPYHPVFISTLPDRSKKNLQPTIRKSGIVENETDIEPDDSPSYLEDFSLRKAFVYSEIMQRKY